MVKVIMVVEDDKAVRQLLVDTFNEFNPDYQVIAAQNGKQALELSSDVKVHLITLDLDMPVMDGNTFLNKFSAIDAQVPVIVISAKPKELGPHPQVKASLSKPFDLNDLLKRVSTLVE